MSYSNLINPNLFNLTDNLEDILSIVDIEKTIGKKEADQVFDCLKSINECVHVDLEDDNGYFVGSHAFQVVSSSLQIIVKITKDTPAYAREVIHMFYIENELTIPEHLQYDYEPA